MKLLSLFLTTVLLATSAQGKTQELDKRWSIDVPEEWWYSDAQNLGALRVYTFGPATPDPLQEAPVMLVDASMKGSTPKLIRGISLGVARGNVAVVAMQGAQRISRKDSWLGDGYRKEVHTIDGNLILQVFVFEARKLPGEPLPGPDSRLAIVHIAGKTEEELEQFIKIFESVKAVAQK